MSWREKLGLPETVDEVDKSTTSVTSVTGFGGTRKTEFSLELGAEHPVVVGARKLLNDSGVRIMILEGIHVIGVWADLDGLEVRAALRSLGHALLPVRYLDGPGIPDHYKLRNVDGEPVPAHVLASMEKYPSAPWTVRDRMLKEMASVKSGGVTPPGFRSNRSLKNEETEGRR